MSAERSVRDTWQRLGNPPAGASIGTGPHYQRWHLDSGGRLAGARVEWGIRTSLRPEQVVDRYKDRLPGWKDKGRVLCRASTFVYFQPEGSDWIMERIASWTRNLPNPMEEDGTVFGEREC